MDRCVWEWEIGGFEEVFGMWCGEGVLRIWRVGKTVEIGVIGGVHFVGERGKEFKGRMRKEGEVVIEHWWRWRKLDKYKCVL